MVKGGCFIDAMSINDDCTQWNVYMTVTTLADNGTPRTGQSELLVDVSDTETEIRDALIAHAKSYIDTTWGVTFGAGDTVQVWGPTRSQG